MTFDYKTLSKKCLAEFFGTFCLTFAIISSITTNGGSYQNVIWAHGFSILCMAFIFGPVSGGHFNWAVTLAFLFRKDDRIPIIDFICYWIFQFLGGFCAGFLHYGLFQNYYRTSAGKVDPTVGNIGALATRDFDNLGIAPMFFHECLGTMYLVLAVLLSAQMKNKFIAEGKSYFGAIMIALMISYVGFMGHLSYAGINPARELGPRCAGAVIYGANAAFTSYAWVPVIAPLCGSVLAVGFYHLFDFMYEKGE